ncbi:hypothetical protein ACFO1B_17445 [Dactylosporangium siamense]|uniref:Uncharacterized protein n=1 Tax=Dactylosporangium siamense TaxID=685454 RepID=A0A919U8E2_9ACTN|nr:hypothetical protein [Dactylosporangium siamense]GIG45627.1 hypothetical protein Dsi01nite_036680 [Dactylosporangium siamense]
MGIDLELGDVFAAREDFEACEESGRGCVHDPNCGEEWKRLRDLGPYEFDRCRRFGRINEIMALTGMGYAAEIDQSLFGDAKPGGDAEARQRWREASLRWRSQTAAGRTGIPAFKLMSNDRWLVSVREIDEALAAYASVPAEQRTTLETDPVWVRWLEWLALARERGGFEAE